MVVACSLKFHGRQKTDYSQLPVVLTRKSRAVLIWWLIHHDRLFVLMICHLNFLEYENGLPSTTILKLSSLKAFVLLFTWLAVKQRAEDNVLPNCADKRCAIFDPQPLSFLLGAVYMIPEWLSLRNEFRWQSEVHTAFTCWNRTAQPKGWFPLTRVWLRTLKHVNFNHVNKIEDR